MIVGTIKDCEVYNIFGGGLAQAFDFLKHTDLNKLDTGKHVLSGDDVFALVSDYKTKPSSTCFFERHEKYIDVQYVVSGEEYIGYAPFEDQEVVTAYNDEHDYALHKGDASFVKIKEGMFAIFFPSDLHMPGTGDASEDVRKIVVKVKI